MRGALDYSPPPHLEAGRSASRLEEESPPFKIGEVNRNRSTVPRENSKEALQRVDVEFAQSPLAVRRVRTAQ